MLTGLLCSLIETYDGSDFATSGQTCPTGQYVEEIDSNGNVQCSSPESGNPIMPGSITGGSYMNDAPLSGLLYSTNLSLRIPVHMIR